MSKQRVSDGSLHDLVLVSEAMAGDGRAFDMLFKRYYRRVYRLVFRMVRHDELAEDLVQETFLRVLRSLPGFRGECSFYTWLFRIALNTASNAVANKESQIFLNATEFRDDERRPPRTEGAEPWSAPERALMDKQVLQLLSQAVSELPDHLARAISLRCDEGLSYEAIAHHMHCPVGTVRSRIWRAREFLHLRLDAQV